MPRAKGCRRALWLPAGLALLALLPAACAMNPTPYQPLGDAGGYEQTRLQERVYRVSFRGNRYTPESRVIDFLFLRCAELTEEAGFTHFKVREDFGRTAVDLRSGGPRTSVGVGFGVGGPSSFWALGLGAGGPAYYDPVVTYNLAMFVIEMLTAEEAAQAERAGTPVYEAAFLVETLRPKAAQSRQREG